MVLTADTDEELLIREYRLGSVGIASPAICFLNTFQYSPAHAEKMLECAIR